MLCSVKESQWLPYDVFRNWYNSFGRSSVCCNILVQLRSSLITVQIATGTITGSTIIQPTIASLLTITPMVSSRVCACVCLKFLYMNSLVQTFLDGILSHRDLISTKLQHLVAFY